MIRAIDNKPLYLSEEEFEYYQAIIATFGQDTFADLFETDDNTQSPNYGFITLVKPPLTNKTPLGAVFFCFNIMLNQRLRIVEDMCKIQAAEIKKLEAINVRQHEE